MPPHCLTAFVLTIKTPGWSTNALKNSKELTLPNTSMFYAFLVFLSVFAKFHVQKKKKDRVDKINDVTLRRAMMQGPIHKQRILVYETGDFGLGNRLQAVVSAFTLATRTNRSFILKWTNAGQSNAMWGELFKVSSDHYKTDLIVLIRSLRTQSLVGCSKIMIFLYVATTFIL